MPELADKLIGQNTLSGPCVTFSSPQTHFVSGYEWLFGIRFAVRDLSGCIVTRRERRLLSSFADGPGAVYGPGPVAGEEPGQLGTAEARGRPAVLLVRSIRRSESRAQPERNLMETNWTASRSAAALTALEHATKEAWNHSVSTKNDFTLRT